MGKGVLVRMVAGELGYGLLVIIGGQQSTKFIVYAP